MLISDHINLQGVNPLVGANEDDFGPTISRHVRGLLADASGRSRRNRRLNWASMLSEGVYAAMLGPCYETPAEIRYLRIIGADLVGMSTVPEVIVANHMGMKVLAISCVTNMAAGILDRKIDHQEVLETGRQVRETFVSCLKAVIPKLDAEV